jgi:predicted SAM-dependent methyltransferase
MKSLLKRSKFIVAFVRMVRAMLADAKVLVWCISRKRAISKYLKVAPSSKLHLGASHSFLSGWLNTDVDPVRKGVIYLDATMRFPFRDNTFDYVFSEHMIEHVDYAGAVAMLRECYRVLKPGGKVRIATPNMEILIGLHSKEKTEIQKKYVQWIANRCLPHIKDCTDVFVINNGFRAWGHQFLYDPDTLRTTISRQGFENLVFYKPGISEDPDLNGLETHGKQIQAEDLNQYETLVVEGECRKGDLK